MDTKDRDLLLAVHSYFSMMGRTNESCGNVDVVNVHGTLEVRVVRFGRVHPAFRVTRGGRVSRLWGNFETVRESLETLLTR